jgi:hypothetical protein
MIRKRRVLPTNTHNPSLPRLYPLNCDPDSKAKEKQPIPAITNNSVSI